MKSKYIVFDTPLCDQIIIFGDTLQHNEIARMLHIPKRDITSAGFLTIYQTVENNEIVVECYGKSISLQLEANIPRDSVLAKRALGLNF